MPVREDDALDLAKIGAEPRRVALEGEIFWPLSNSTLCRLSPRVAVSNTEKP
jgi:hypothetical protein